MRDAMLSSLDTMVGRVLKAIQVHRETVLKIYLLYNCAMYMPSVLAMQHCETLLCCTCQQEF
jgi:hypothetical protein